MVTRTSDGNQCSRQAVYELIPFLRIAGNIAEVKILNVGKKLYEIFGTYRKDHAYMWITRIK